MEKHEVTAPLAGTPLRRMLRNGTGDPMRPPVLLPGIIELGADYAPSVERKAGGGASGRCPDCMQRHFCLPQGLTSDEMRRLGGLLSGSRSVARHASLFRAGDSLDCVYVLKSGVIKLVWATSNGDEQVLGFCLPGEILGLEAMGAESCANCAVAIETATVCELPIEALERMCREMPRLQHQLHLLFARQIVNSHAALTVVGKGNAEAGLASLLLDLAHRLKAQGYSGKEFNLCMSRTDIANYLGIAVETVSRMFTRLHKKGVLRVEKRNIVILNPDYLRAVAGESAAIARAQPGCGYGYQDARA